MRYHYLLLNVAGEKIIEEKRGFLPEMRHLGIWQDEDHYVYPAGEDSNMIYKVNLLTGSVEQVFP